MIDENDEKSILPAYAPYRTVLNFSMGIRHAPPSIIDRSMMGTLGGGVRGQLMATLRYLGLIDARGRMQEIYRRFIASEGEERQKILRDILHAAYPFLFQGGPDFNLETATPNQFADKFQKVGAKGDTLRKCQLFFIAACQAAGIALSPHLVKGKPNHSDAPKQNRTRAPKKKNEPDLPQQPVSAQIATQTANQNSEFAFSAREKAMLMMADKYPSFDPNWPAEVQQAWMANFGAIWNTMKGEG